jgi:diphosphoinositol-polyphosphate diphosphatase
MTEASKTENLDPPGRGVPEQNSSFTDTMTDSDFGRIKAPPVCKDLNLKNESMSTAELQQFVFETDALMPITRMPSSSLPNIVTTPVVRTNEQHHMQLLPQGSDTILPSTSSSQDVIAPLSAHIPVSVVSVCSNHSICTKTGDDSQGDNDPQTVKASPALDHEQSEHLNAKVAMLKTSRQGRSAQRWTTTLLNMNDGHSSSCGGSVGTAAHHEPLRLVTGCVPILKDGKILFVSASRKAAWILPKGGWEQDESMEESAIRECFEEAGCFGKLGPALTPVQYETRKSKKRRAEQQELLQTKNGDASNSTSIQEDTSPLDQNEDVHAISSAANGNTSTAAMLSAEAMSRIREQASAVAPKNMVDETMSVASTFSSTYSHVQMTLFPLYVTKIADDWPEKGRFRRAADLDQAIAMMEGRPEFKAVLLEVKERGLHLISDVVAATNAESEE